VTARCSPAFDHSIRVRQNFNESINCSKKVHFQSQFVISGKLFGQFSISVNEIVGALGEIRTPDPRIRSPMLYPAELRAQFRTHRISELSEQFYGAESQNVW
jgi:hypothetical protein